MTLQRNKNREFITYRLELQEMLKGILKEKKNNKDEKLRFI